MRRHVLRVDAHEFVKLLCRLRLLAGLTQRRRIFVAGLEIGRLQCGNFFEQRQRLAHQGDGFLAFGQRQIKFRGIRQYPRVLGPKSLGLLGEMQDGIQVGLARVRIIERIRLPGGRQQGQPEMRIGGCRLRGPVHDLARPIARRGPGEVGELEIGVHQMAIGFRPQGEFLHRLPGELQCLSLDLRGIVMVAQAVAGEGDPGHGIAGIGGHGGLQHGQRLVVFPHVRHEPGHARGQGNILRLQLHRLLVGFQGQVLVHPLLEPASLVKKRQGLRAAGTGGSKLHFSRWRREGLQIRRGEDLRFRLGGRGQHSRHKENCPATRHDAHEPGQSKERPGQSSQSAIAALGRISTGRTVHGDTRQRLGLVAQTLLVTVGTHPLFTLMLVDLGLPSLLE